MTGTPSSIKLQHLLLDNNDCIIIGGGKMNKKPSDYPQEGQTFERKPTGGLNKIAEKPFTVTKIETFEGKDGKEYCIVETKETFDNIPYNNEEGEKVTGSVNRFFVDQQQPKKFLKQEGVMADVNENGNTIEMVIEQIPFTKEEIERNSNLRGKTHYIIKDVNKKTQEKIG